MSDNSTTASRMIVSGRVQGVGFRWWCSAQARELGLAGSARNRPDGTVEVRAQGSPEAVRVMGDRLREEPSTYGRPGDVTEVEITDAEPDAAVAGFTEQ